ncbi:MAG TPA: alpha/beta hydrolase [Solirubrobacteraceae bacterium]|nr:alpha/beta hydrolase [Solirubrobacteraceae bacterium]
MPADRSAAPVSRAEGPDAADADHERFVFGADPVRDRWWGRPLAETRWCLELARLLADPVWRGAGVPCGDGRPVVLMPGFGGGDQTLLVMAAWLRRLGYRPRFVGFVTNSACSDRALDRVERTVDELWRSHGRRIALIGHSRGGHFARALAARRPDLVSHAIATGADLQGMFGASRPTLLAATVARRAAHASGRARRNACVRLNRGAFFRGRHLAQVGQSGDEQVGAAGSGHDDDQRLPMRCHPGVELLGE